MAAVYYMLLLLAAGAAVIGSSSADPMPDLLAYLPYPLKELWAGPAKELWDVLDTGDFDCHDKYGKIAACKSADFAIPNGIVPPEGGSVKPSKCGRIARIWIRVVFHDGGTFNRFDKTGGCDGSIQYELPDVPPHETLPPFFALKRPLKAVPCGRETNFVSCPNFGFWPSIILYQSLREKNADAFKAKGYPEPSMADMVSLAGDLATAICKGPYIQFKPGRKDAEYANEGGLLPNPFGRGSDAVSLMTAFDRMDLSPYDMVALLGSHSCAAFSFGNLDTTPNVLDNNWYKEMPKLDSCVADEFGNSAGKSPCALPSDSGLMDHPLTAAHMKLFAVNQASFHDKFKDTFTRLQNLGQFGYVPVLKGARLRHEDPITTGQIWTYNAARKK
eukprot:jgi/Chrzof1/12742/Cz07g05270.t1